MASVVSNGPEFGAGKAIDLSQLSEAERRVLRLLAHGHTAKSIASSLGSTPTVINERLRQARRKTGLGSSREVARLLVAQENRHENIELAQVPDGQFHGLRTSEDRFRILWIGAPIMIIVVIATLGIATQAGNQPRSQPALNDKAIVDPIVGRIPPSGEVGVDQLYLRLRAEKRDASWAPRNEQALRDHLVRIRYVGQPGDPLRVICGSTICEAAGIINGPTTKQGEKSLDRSMQALQGKDIHDFVASLGLDPLGGSFQSPNSHTPPRFLLYFQRKR